MFRVRRSKLTLLASAVGATLPAWGFAQNTATWSYAGGGGNQGPWAASWTDTSALKPWAPNNTFPNAALANPLFPGTFVSNGVGTITLGIGVTVNSLNFYGGGTNSVTTPAGVNTDGYQIVGAGSINFFPSSGNQAGTIDVEAIGRDFSVPATPITLPGMATLAVSIAQTSGTLYKTGLGTLVLNASNNFNGAGMQINDGVVRVLQSDALAGLEIIATGNTGGLELYNNASNINSQGTVVFGGLSGTTPSANGELAAMGGSNSTWGGPSSLMFIYGNPSLGADATSTLTIGATIVDGGTNGLTKVGAGTVITSGLQLNGPLNVNAGMLRIAKGGTANSTTNVVTTSTLSIAGGGTPTATLDLTNNSMIVNYTGSSPLATIAAQIKSGYNGGAWNGPGIVSSMIPTSPNAGELKKTALGYAEASALGGTATSSFGGVPTDSTTVIVKYTYAGDANLDGSVDLSDASAWLNNYTGPTGSGKTWSQGDWNYDGAVDLSDASIWLNDYTGPLGNAGLSPILTDVPLDVNPQAVAILENMGIGIQYVPEPGTLGIMGIGLGVLATKRRRHRA